ncbi:MAG: hypothetical protein GY880_32620 [Planctomycetaceae bacterium]|nr:hypothetical protein [Planctomycetaceae bacterium]
MTIQHLLPTSKPTLDLNFAAERQLDPHITFTRSSIGTYVDKYGKIQTAGANQPRFDHDPATGESLGLLVEESRTNLCIQSETFSSNPFTFTQNVTISKNQTDPTGGTNASLVTHTATTAVHRIGEKISTVRSTRSFFVKKVNQRYLYLGDQNGGGFAPNYRFDLDTGTGVVIRDVNNGNFGFDIIAFPNGYYRINVDCNSGDIFTIVASNTFSSTGSNPANSTQAETSDGTEQFIIWGYQVEAGSFPTSYIPTSGSTVTRSADVASITGTNFSSWWNPNNGTFFSHSRPLLLTSNAQYGGMFGADGGSVTNPLTMDVCRLLNPPGAESGLRSPGTSGFDIFTTSADPLNRKFVTSFDNLGSLSICGGLAVVSLTDAVNGSGAVASVDGYYFGGRFNTSGLNKHVSRIAYYPRRLSDEQLQALTA